MVRLVGPPQGPRIARTQVHEIEERSHTIGPDSTSREQNPARRLVDHTPAVGTRPGQGTTRVA